MILAVDIGNTAIKLALMQGTRIKQYFQVPTLVPAARLSKEIRGLIKKIPARSQKVVEAVIVCSVVPTALRLIVPILRSQFKEKVWVVGSDIPVPIINRYRDPKQVGQDRLVGAFAALRLYQAPLVIIDLGTAITIDVISRKREYLGGIIVPGIKLSAESLNQKTALLPKVTITRPKAVIGRDTATSILSGIFHGYGEMLSGLINLISKEQKSRPTVILTGGYSELMQRYIHPHRFVINKTLIFRGLQMIWEGFKAGDNR